MAKSMILREAKQIPYILEMVGKCLLFPGRWVLKFEQFNKKRSNDQNALSHAWYRDVATQKEDLTGLQARCESKLHCGVPILLTDSDKFREQWYRMIKDRFTYEEKLELMEWFPVTSLMGTKQMSYYLERMQIYWGREGVTLQFPCEYDPNEYREAS